METALRLHSFLSDYHSSKFTVGGMGAQSVAEGSYDYLRRDKRLKRAVRVRIRLLFQFHVIL